MTRWRGVALVATVLMLLAAVGVGATVIPFAIANPGPNGSDFTWYMEATRNWLAGDGLYYPHQLAGPYVIEGGDSMYPPVILYLTVPFALVPALVPLWWAVPLGIIAYALARHRPAWWAWPYLAFVLALPRTWADVLYGNPAMWSVAAVAAGTLWGWPAVGAALKPALAPFALVGLARREWRRRYAGALAVALVLAVPFGALWIDYAHVLLNARNPWGLGYLLWDIPIAAAPVVAWAARSVPKQRPDDAPERGEVVEGPPLPLGVRERHPLGP